MEEKPSSSPVDPPKKMKRLTRKQAKLARARVKDPEGTLTEIGLRAGYAGKQQAKRALDTEHVQDQIRRLMDANPKLTNAALTKKLAAGLDATFVKVFQTKDGEIIESDEYEDLPTRHRYLETAAEWKGIAEKRVHVTGDAEAPLSLAAALDILRRAQAVETDKA